MRCMYKYTLALIDNPQAVSVPVGGVTCYVGFQGEQIAVWIEVDPDAEPELRRFTVEGTGHPIPPGAVYVGTAQESGRALVWHVYELPKRG